MDIKTLWETIKSIFSEMWPVIWPSIKIVLTDAGKYTLATAINVVKQVQEEMPNATGQEKASVAFARISEILVAQGISVGTSIIKLAIEYAYQHMVAEPAVIEEGEKMMGFMAAKAEMESNPVPDWVK